ncbi:MAG: 4-hydroxy-tetrahydrodipicolinate synthase [Bacteriovoracaceae bacterium]|jgi:4-hydroxy-tetrahydrodipicolinate synthase|nr:4-hydroxy-tetrahydrodipicolinate synthase [Bacteriovoracaceae bacterium]
MTINEYALWTAIITPLDQDGLVDFVKLELLLKKQEEASNGVVILGSTGESLNLDLSERKKIVEFSTDLNLSIPLLVGVGGVNLGTTLEWVKYLEGQKVQGYLMVTPLYAKPNDIGQKNWFQALLDKASRPCMLYNVPGRTGTPISLKALIELQDHPNFWSVKEASGSIERFGEFVDSLPSKKVFSGDDALLPYFALRGATGLVSVAANVWPAQTHLYTKFCLTGRGSETLPLWEKASASLFTASNPIPAKALLHAKEWIETPFLRPPLTHEDFHELESIKEIDSQIDTWYKKNA